MHTPEALSKNLIAYNAKEYIKRKKLNKRHILLRKEQEVLKRIQLCPVLLIFSPNVVPFGKRKGNNDKLKKFPTNEKKNTYY
ncbi:hypothetical protein GDO81_017108 [Engystomops pustulosus]|uniref:Uncharacterized protein n=1 Tax=Engystomops pustulosus TaxID=76066 RepID=A0AAV7AEZ0_ENGPU|nr:hypothetical protein GDO81_017108 [Engystomops pustulosus]